LNRHEVVSVVPGFQAALHATILDGRRIRRADFDRLDKVSLVKLDGSLALPEGIHRLWKPKLGQETAP
jgi:hypothetical protein